MAKTVLIVEDERAIVEILKFNLKREGYETLEALDGETGLLLAQTKDPDLILLDVMLPKMSGFDICKTLRGENRTTPIIMLTAREEEMDKVFGLETGADDYMTKPFSMKELMARVKANIRRRSMEYASAQASGTANTVEANGLCLNPETYQVTKNGAPVDLTQKEYDLLSYLIRERGKVFSREDLMQRVWNYDYYGDMRTVDVTVRRLREKIEDDPDPARRRLLFRGITHFPARERRDGHAVPAHEDGHDHGDPDFGPDADDWRVFDERRRQFLCVPVL
jgi:two-component system response regulator VicR